MISCYIRAKIVDHMLFRYCVLEKFDIFSLYFFFVFIVIGEPTREKTHSLPNQHKNGPGRQYY